MKKIIHFSDIHFGYKVCSARFENIVSALINQKDNPSQYIIVISGDLVEDANQEGIYEQANVFLEKLKQAGFYVLVVPGNHDYGTGDMGDKKFVPLFQKAFFGQTLTYPKLDIIDDIAFIGIDSIAEELNWHDAIFAEGEIGAAQLARLRSMLVSPEVKDVKHRVVYLHHHPFDHRPLHELKDSNHLKQVFDDAKREGTIVDALLYGHNHEGKAHNGHWGIKRCYDAGSATLKPRPAWVSWLPWFKVFSSVREITLDEPVENDKIINLIDL